MCAQQNKNVVPSRIQNQSWLQDWWQDFIQLWHNLSPQEALFGGVQGEVSLGKRQQGIFLHSLNEMASSHVEREEVASKETRICSDKHRAGISSVCLASNERGCWSKLCWMCCQGWFAAAACWGLGIDSAWWRLVMVYVTSVFKKPGKQSKRRKVGVCRPRSGGCSCRWGPRSAVSALSPGQLGGIPPNKRWNKEKRNSANISSARTAFFSLFSASWLFLTICTLEFLVTMMILHQGLHEVTNIICVLFFSCVSFTCLLLQVPQDCVLLPLAGWFVILKHSSVTYTDKNTVYASICGYFCFSCFTWHSTGVSPVGLMVNRVMSLHRIYFGNIQECKEA